MLSDILSGTVAGVSAAFVLSVFNWIVRLNRTPKIEIIQISPEHYKIINNHYHSIIIGGIERHHDSNFLQEPTPRAATSGMVIPRRRKLLLTVTYRFSVLEKFNGFLGETFYISYCKAPWHLRNSQYTDEIPLKSPMDLIITHSQDHGRWHYADVVVKAERY
ncbi:hypothetical protein [Arcanobacterium phocae]|uniref:hypothetical protein n=1 Tax=Arcanobacterium phocae TaxID=131112 RepID=UPI001C0ED77A|nr:hypothetical protein [Arcanobacterium phocae]